MVDNGTVNITINTEEVMREVRRLMVEATNNMERMFGDPDSIYPQKITNWREVIENDR